MASSVVKKGGKHHYVHSWSSNPPVMNCRGKRIATKWGKGELDAANTLTEKVKSILGREIILTEDEQPESTFALRGKPRFARFLFHLHDTARHQYDLAFRITSFIQSLEILLGTTSSELTYRLSVRVATLLGKTGGEKREIFETLKKCYAIRSTLIHGDVFNPRKVKEFGDICERLEDFVRTLACNLLLNDELLVIFNQSSEDLERSFTNHLFDGRLVVSTDIDT